MPDDQNPRRPVSLVVATVLVALSAVAFLTMAVLSWTSGHGEFSGGVGILLLAWSLLLGLIAWGVHRARRWARGPAVATSLLHLASCLSFAQNQPVALAGAAVAAAAVVALLWPSTTAAFRFR